jgi:hypothetical protein
MLPRLLRSAALMTVALLGLAGCMSARTQESRELPTQIASSESVVILAKPQIEGAAADAEFMDCVGKGLGSSGQGIAVQDNDRFVDSLFPWLEPATAPRRPEGVTQLLMRPGVSEAIATTGVRYLVWLDGATKKTGGGGSLACGVAPGAAGCLGFGWWENEANYEATIWDVKQAKSAGSVETNVTGTSAIVGAVVPLPFIARVEGTACQRLADQLQVFFKGGTAAR